MKTEKEIREYMKKLDLKLKFEHFESENAHNYFLGRFWGLKWVLGEDNENINN